MSDARYQVVSERKRAGELLDRPDGADDVTVELSREPGVVTVTYLKPMTRVPIQDDSAPSYVE